MQFYVTIYSRVPLLYKKKRKHKWPVANVLRRFPDLGWAPIEEADSQTTIIAQVAIPIVGPSADIIDPNTTLFLSFCV